MRALSGLLLAGVLAVALQTPTSVRSQPATPPSLDVWVMDIGQGACILVECPNRDAAILVDCGTDRSSRRIVSDKVARWVDAKLASKAFTTLMISHAHTDHYRMMSGGAIDPKHISQAFVGGRREHYNHTIKSSPKYWLNNFLEKIGGPSADPVHAYAPATFVADDATFRCAPATTT